MGAVYLISRKWVFGRVLCRIWVAADVTFCTCSVVTICIISADRYLAVTRPLRYKSLVTKFKVIGIMISIWTFSSLILLTTVKWETNKCADEYVCYAGNEIRYLAHSVVFAFFIPASVTLTLYWRIYKLARNRQKALDRGFLMILGHNMNFLTNTLSQNTTLRVHFGNNNGMVEHQRRVLRTHERIAKTLDYQCKGCVPTIAIDIASWLGYCNSMINPIIYSFTVKDFKRSALRLILPIWQFVFHCLPVKILPKPPDRIARVSRSGQKAKNRRNFEPKNRVGRNGVSNVSNGRAKQLMSEATFNKTTIPSEQVQTIDKEERRSSNSSDNDELLNIASVDDFTDPSILTDPTTTNSESFCIEKNFRWAKRKRNSSCKEPLTMPVSRHHMNTTRSTPTKLSEWLEKTRRARKAEETNAQNGGNINSWNSVKLTARMRRHWAFGQKKCSHSMEANDGDSKGTPDIEDLKKSLKAIDGKSEIVIGQRYDSNSTLTPNTPKSNNIEYRGSQKEDLRVNNDPTTFGNQESSNDHKITNFPNSEDHSSSSNTQNLQNQNSIFENNSNTSSNRRGTLNKSTSIDHSYGLAETPLLSYRPVECRGAAQIIRGSFTRKMKTHTSNYDQEHGYNNENSYANNTHYGNSYDKDRYDQDNHGKLYNNDHAGYRGQESDNEDYVEDPQTPKASDEEHPEDPCTPKASHYRLYNNIRRTDYANFGKNDNLTPLLNSDAVKGSVESVRIYMLTEEEDV
ncbi:unnamed protein product [Bursaphelenchus okinawaensis]|uniref:G-protein coupled receptors family 1 profile domain-containing protein n=1 Tax=Bursaphelenchus okinawaensis TaxID=465554 RepID=A0A811JR90_9BILA|nr:unnamed protein product [Bursaphelenchus okinawaensis]CAG9079126.1 unnamed protein product [Bursaphelenchus okinawaensis]